MRIPGLSLLLAAIPVSLVSCQRNSFEPAPVHVKVMQAAASSVSYNGRYTGSVCSATSANLSFGIPGIVVEVAVSEGQDVKEGELLARIDDTSYISAYGTAKSLYDQAQDAYNRLKGLHDSKSLADIKWVEVESQLAQAKNMLDIAEKELGNCRITAPFSGTISTRNIEPGQYSVPAVTAFTIINPDDMMCTFSVPENEVSLFRYGMTARVTIPSLDNEVMDGTVCRIGTSASLMTHAYEVGVEIGSAPGVLRPGMICSISVNLHPDEMADKQIVLPSNAIMLDFDNSHYVWVAQGDTIATRRSIGIGRAVANGIEVISGLDGNESIITDGLLKISEGSKIIICE